MSDKPGLHLVKLCVGVSAIEELQAWIDYRLEQRKSNCKPDEQIHTTRMVPKRADELLAGGSLYWVIKGNIQIRQHLLDIRPFTDKEGIRRCDLVLEPRLIATRWQPRRPFQGWRYFKASEVPPDLGVGDDGEDMPPDLQLELSELGLL
jgi:hypothetical protein